MSFGERSCHRQGRRNKHLGSTVAALLMVLAACGGGGSDASAEPAPTPAVQQKHLTVDGMSRSYRLFTPLSLDRSRPAPLVLVLAGVGNTAQDMVTATEFDRMADSGEFLVAYPEGVNETWNGGYCCLGRATTGPDDIAFLSRVIDDVQATSKIDPARVFAVGFSAGAIMAHKLGCDLSGRIAGVGSVAGAMVLDECRPSRPVSVIEIHGTADGLVPYEGGRTAGGATQPSPTTRDVMKRWAELNGCPAAPSTLSEGVLSTSTWTGCSAGSSVKLITIDGGGHTWFAPLLGPANGAVDATKVIWEFLSGLRPKG
ncbi:MAG: polyhydroxybutyrate depolymerase [Actinobacteria bacterium]|nr:polyhydroxybutyrate depolymerase [Actinomycetota bacterium]